MSEAFSPAPVLPADAAVVPAHGRFRPPAMESLYAATFALLGWTVGISPLRDNSFLWHLRTGHWILHHGVPYRDLYSFTAPGTHWVAQSWLAEVVYAVADGLGGTFAIRLLSAAAGAVIGHLTYRLAARISGRRVPAAAMTLAALGASASCWVTRPLFFGLLALVVLLWIVEVPESVLGRRPRVAVPLLMWVWADLHGSFMLGFGYLGLHLAGRWADGAPPWRGRERRLAQAALLALPVCLANPYGLSLLIFPIALMMRGDVLSAIVEWQSPNFREQPGIAFAVWIAVFVGVLALARRRMSRRDVIVAIPFLLLALWAQRNILVAPLIGLPVLARILAAPGRTDAVPSRTDAVPSRTDAAPSRTEAVAGRTDAGPGRAEAVPGHAPGPPRGVSGDRRRVNAVLLALIVVLGGLWTARSAQHPRLTLSGTYPIAAMRAVERRGLLGHRLLTTDVWAGYVIYRYWPRQHVFIDDRYDMYPVALSKDYFQLIHGGPGWAAPLSTYQIDVVVWEPKAPLTQFLAFAPGWTRIYQDRLAVVFARVPPPS